MHKILINLILLFLLFLLFCIILKKKQKELYANFENNFTICIKTIYRSNLLEENIRKIRAIYPSVNIIIADDSDDIYKKKNQRAINNASKNDKYITYIPLPYNSGLSKGRNECIKRVKTDYTIITDDSRFINTKNNILQEIIKYMKKEDISLVTGNIENSSDSSYLKVFDYCLDKNNNNIFKPKIKEIMKNRGVIRVKKKNNINTKQFNNLKFKHVNVGVNCFIAKTSIFKNNKWDETRGTHNCGAGYTEHEDFFFRLWLNGITVNFCKQFNFLQANNKLRAYDKNGNQLRNRKIDKSKIYQLLII